MAIRLNDDGWTQRRLRIDGTVRRQTARRRLAEKRTHGVKTGTITPPRPGDLWPWAARHGGRA